MRSQDHSKQPNLIEASPKDIYAFYTSGRAAQLWNDKQAWAMREQIEADFYGKVLQDYGVKRVVDVAAAAGFHAIKLAQAGYDVVAVDGLAEFVELGKINQRNAQLEFPFVDLSWSQLMPAILKHADFDAALCLGGSLHHTDQLGVAELFRNVRSILAEGGLFIVEQRNYDRLFQERPQVTTHPCGWKYDLRYQEPRTLYFHLTDVERDIDVNFQGIITFEQELLDIAREQGFNLEQKFFDYGNTGAQEQATWIEYVFRLAQLN